MKRFFSLKEKFIVLMMLGLILWLCILFAQAVETGTIGVGVTDLEVSYSWSGAKGASVDTSGGQSKFDLTVKSGDLSNWEYPSTEMSVYLKNNSDNEAKLSFSWNVSKTNGSWTVDGSNAKSGTVTERILKSQESVVISIQSNTKTAANWYGVVMGVTDIKLEQIIKTAQVTFKAPVANGSYTVDGTQITGDTSYTKASTYKYALVATAAEGYVFAGWKNYNTNEYLPGDASCSKAFSEDMTIQPVFAPEDSAQFGVGSQKFFNLNVANNYANSQSEKTIVLLKSGTLPEEDYTISTGVTLLIPYSEGNTSPNTTEPSIVTSANQNRAAYRTLTIPKGVTLNVDGAINVNGQVLQNESIPTGPYGLITLESGAVIQLNDGANLYCWGYINGDGDVIAKNGATVYECFQMQGWRGGNASSNIVKNADSKKVFVLNQFYIQNVEAALTFEYGATEMIFASVTVSNQQCKATEALIAKDRGMFRPGVGCKLTKKYIPSTDRLLFSVDGDMTVGNIELDLSIDLLVTTIGVNIQSQKYVLPIGSNYSVDIFSGTTTIASNQDVALLPGAEFTVSEGATFATASNMYVYDRDEWIGKNYAYGGDLRVVGYSTTNGTTAMRTAADLVDGTIDVNGTMNISGKLYTTKSGANIFSTKGTGHIHFGSATTDSTTTYQVTQDGTTVTYVGIPCTSAQLCNGDGSYTETTGAQAGWEYMYDTVAQRWYRFRVKYQFNGADIGEDLITTNTSTKDVSFADGSDLLAEVVSGSVSGKCTVSGNTLTVDGITSDCTINIKGVAASYTPSFVLNEHQYKAYRSFGGSEITSTVDIDGKTYYVVKACSTMEFGAPLEKPADADMGVSEAAHNSITWFLEDVTTGAQVFMNTVPSGATKGGPVYIYGIYSGSVAVVTKDSEADGEYYSTLKDAVVNLPITGSATLQMLANCGTFEDESKTAVYSLSANIIFDVNGKEVWGSIVNNGTLTIQDTTGGGKIITDAVSSSGAAQNYASAVRNNGTLTMEGVTAQVTQTSNDYSAVVLNYNGGLIAALNNCHLISGRGYGVFNFGGTIQSINGGAINGGDANTAGRYGIRNMNMRSGSQTEANPYAIAKLGTIETISGINIYVYQYGIQNYATINMITGNTNINTTGSYAIYNGAGWYYDTQVTKSVTTEANNTKTTVYTYDTKNYPTIKEISGNASVSAEGNYALWNSGNIEKISGNMSGTGVQFERPNGNYVFQNSGYIGEISGRVTISAPKGSYGLMQNIWGNNPRVVAQTYIQKDVDADGTYTGTGDIREYNYEYTAPVIDKIGGGVSEVIISCKNGSNALYNYGTINSISDGVEISTTGTCAVVNGSDGGGYKTFHRILTNLGKNDATERFETRVEEERTRYQAKIGSITGDVKIQSNDSDTLQNGGIIETIGSDVNLSGTSSTINNTKFTRTWEQYVCLGYNASNPFGTSAEAGRIYAYTAIAPTITTIDGATIQATTGSSAIYNGGTIGKIQNSVISAKGSYAINNTGNVVTERKIYKDNSHSTEYALTELFAAFFTRSSDTNKFTSVEGSATPNHIDTYDATPTIQTIGAGNKISAAKQTILNYGEITTIDSGSGTKTEITATDQGGSGQAIYNVSCLHNAIVVTDGTSVKTDYLSPAHIGTIKNAVVTASFRAIQNGDGGAYLNVIDEIGVETQVSSKISDALYNASKNAKVTSITDGIFTAQGAGMYAVDNKSSTDPISIAGGYFKGGNKDRTTAIYQPDETTRQTYPDGNTLSKKTTSVTLADGTTADGYYYIAENKFVLKFDANGSTTYPATGSVDAMTVALPATTVTLPANGFTRSGYIFAGWAVDKNTGADNTSSLLVPGSVALSKLGDPGAGDEITLYAIWKPNKVYNVTVNWSGNLAYTYVPSVYKWDAQDMRYKLLTESYWKGDDPAVTVTNVGGSDAGVTYGAVNVGIGYTKETGYDAFDMNFYVGDTTVAYKNTATLASGLMPGGNSVKATMKLIGTLPSGMAQGSAAVGKVALTVTTAD